MFVRRIIVPLLGILLAIPALSAGAQTPAAIPNEEDLIELQAAVGRSYMPAGTFAAQGTINLDASPVASPAPPSHLRIVVREFDSTDNATAAFEQISAGIEALMPDVFSSGTQEITSETLPDIGSRATLVRAEHVERGSRYRLENAIVQRDRYVFFVSVDVTLFPISGSESADMSLPTAEIAAAVASGDASPDEPAFSDDGTSTGGLLGFMPPAGDPLLMGLVPVGDNIMYPVPST